MLSKIYLIFLFSIILPNVQPQTQSLRTDFPKNRVNITSTSKQKTLSESSTQIKPLPLTLGSSNPINSNQRPSLPPVSMTYKEFYEKYKKNSPRVPSQQQMKFRAWIFQQNLRKINQHNANPQRKFDLGVNVFADITEQQFTESYSYNPFNQKVLVADISIDQKLPNINIDWSCKSSRVWDQGDCGCGYLMAAINSIQITMRIHNINVQNLSVQQILSCSMGSSSAGCAGGLAHGVLDYIKEKGVGPDRLYKYEEKSKKQSSKCDNTILNNKNYVNSKVFIKDYKKIRTGDCLQLIQKLKSHAIVAKVSNKLLKFYQNGTIDNGPYINFDHYVTVVGYNATDQTFKIQNSWGTQWGNKGFAYLSKNAGICFRAYYPILSQELQNVGPGCK